MGIRPHCLCLTLLAALVASGAPLTADPLPPSGVLTPSPSSVSTILINADALIPSICDAPVAPGTGNLVRCTVKVLNDAQKVPMSRIYLEPATTPCGVVQRELIFYLDSPPVPPPAAEGDGDPGPGVSANALAISTFLHLTNHETGQTAEIWMHLGTDLTGSGSTPANTWWWGSGKLYLNENGELIGEFEECIPKWFTTRYPNYRIQEGQGEDQCTICPDPEDRCLEYGEDSECADGQILDP